MPYSGQNKDQQSRPDPIARTLSHPVPPSARAEPTATSG
jgi:hypothetical protein